MSECAEELQIQERDIIVDPKTKARYRVVQDEGSHAWLMRIGGRFWLRHVHRSSYASFVLEVPIEGKPHSVAALASANATYKRFEAVLADRTKLLREDDRIAAFQAMNKEDKVSSATFYEVIRAWLEGGCTIPALAPDRSRESSSLTAESVEGISEAFAIAQVRKQRDQILAAGYTPLKQRDYIKSGAPRQRHQPSEPSNFGVDAYALRVFLPYFEKKKQGATLPKLHEDMIREVFNLTNAAGESVPVPKWATPSLKTFENWYYRSTSYRDREVNQHGQKHHNLKGRSKLGTLISDAYGAVCDLDATIWNVELVSEDEQARLIGPAVVFRIRCKSSGQLVGIGISLDSASWMGAASAIASCTEPKDILCARHGISIARHQWSACGLPGTIRADCGETHNSKPNAFIMFTDVSLINLQPGRGDLKGGVESDFFVLQTSLNGKTPGAIIKEYEDLTQQQWRVKAQLTLKQFMRVLLLEELKRMHRPRDGFQLPEALSGLGIGTSPAQVWGAGVRYLGGGLKGGFDKSQVELSLMERGKASITEEGLKFKSFLFRSEEHIRIFAYERARGSRRRTVDVAFDRRLIDKIYVLEGDADQPSAYHPAELMTHLIDQRDLPGRGFKEALKIRAERSVNDKVAQEQAQLEVDRWDREQREVFAMAAARVSQARTDHPMSNHALMQQRGEAREQERERTSPEEAFRPEVAAKGAESFPVISSAGSESMQPEERSSTSAPTDQARTRNVDKAERMRKRAENLLKSKSMETA